MTRGTGGLAKGHATQVLLATVARTGPHTPRMGTHPVEVVATRDDPVTRLRGRPCRLRIQADRLRIRPEGRRAPALGTLRRQREGPEPQIPVAKRPARPAVHPPGRIDIATLGSVPDPRRPSAGNGDLEEVRLPCTHPEAWKEGTNEEALQPRQVDDVTPQRILRDRRGIGTRPGPQTDSGRARIPFVVEAHIETREIRAGRHEGLTHGLSRTNGEMTSRDGFFLNLVPDLSSVPRRRPEPLAGCPPRSCSPGRRSEQRDRDRHPECKPRHQRPANPTRVPGPNKETPRAPRHAPVQTTTSLDAMVPP